MRDKLRGKRIMVWTFMGNSRMYQALRDYGDRIDTIGLFSFKVDATGTITESGVAISNMLTYIEKWLHITEYDEQLVRRLIEKITVYEEKVTVEFKSGTSVDVRR